MDITGLLYNDGGDNNKMLMQAQSYARAIHCVQRTLDALTQTGRPIDRPAGV